MAKKFDFFGIAIMLLTALLGLVQAKHNEKNQAEQIREAVESYFKEH